MQSKFMDATQTGHTAVGSTAAAGAPEALHRLQALNQGLQPHGIPRDEWVRRFKLRISQQLDLASSDDSITLAELESWPEHDEQPVEGFPPEWLFELPEHAADDNLSNWTD